MKHITTPSPEHDDRLLVAVTAEVRREAAQIADLIPVLQDAQWSRPVRGPSAPRGKGAPPADPTGEVTVNDRRLRVRAELRTARRHLVQAAALLRGVRAALVRALDAWEGA